MSDSLTRGSFLLSIDAELGGTEKSSRSTRVVTELLELMARYRIRSTWAVLGSSLNPDSQDVLSSQYNQVIREISSHRESQELGCHTFSHVRAGDSNCSRGQFESELRACVTAAGQIGATFRSFVFPYNSVGYVDSLRKFGLVTYRGRSPVWFDRLPAPARRLCHLLDHWFFIPPPVGPATYHHDVWSLPASYFYVCGSGWGKMIPVQLRIKKAKQGLRLAAARRGLFHMWFHPFNLVDKPKMWLKGLDSIFAEVQHYRELGLLDNPTMGELGARLQGPEPSPAERASAV